MNNNENESFALELINHTDSVYHSKTQYENDLYFYGLDGTIKIPCDESNEVNLQFTFGNKYSKEEKIILSLGHIKNNLQFLNQCYLKHQKMLNSFQIDEKYNNILDEILKTPITSKYPYLLEGDHESLCLKFNNIQINLGRALFNHENPKKFNPLEPIQIFCFIKNNDKNIVIKKIIPTYLIEEYPIINKYITPINIANSLSDFKNLLKNLDPNTSIKLEKTILEVQLSSKPFSKPSSNLFKT